MEDLELLAKTFERPANFAMQEQRSEVRDITVRVLFAKEVMRWVRESRSYYTVAEEETAEGLLVTLKIRQESEIVQWLLGWGRHMQVLEPESLRKRMVEEAEGMLQNHTS
jgi:predicted DNA-binding transcriptional regulator YafY